MKRELLFSHLAVPRDEKFQSPPKCRGETTIHCRSVQDDSCTCFPSLAGCVISFFVSKRLSSLATISVITIANPGENRPGKQYVGKIVVCPTGDLRNGKVKRQQFVCTDKTSGAANAATTHYAFPYPHPVTDDPRSNRRPRNRTRPVVTVLACDPGTFANPAHHGPMYQNNNDTVA